MSNMETLVRARQYLEQLANGYDPISGAPLPKDTVLNDVSISRCLFTAADVLRQAIENGGEVSRSGGKKKAPFQMSMEERQRVEVTDTPTQISKFCERINSVVDLEKMKKLKTTAFGTWLVEKGFLDLEERNGKSFKKVTPAGSSVGMAMETRAYSGGEYYVVVYNREAQQFLLDNLDEIIAISNG